MPILVSKISVIQPNRYGCLPTKETTVWAYKGIKGWLSSCWTQKQKPPLGQPKSGGNFQVNCKIQNMPNKILIKVKVSFSIFSFIPTFIFKLSQPMVD